MKANGVKMSDTIETMSYEQLRHYLITEGCEPSLYKRGHLYRAHVNRGGNFWEDAETPIKALRKASMLWVNSGRWERATKDTL